MKQKNYYDDKWYSQILFMLENRKNDTVIFELERYLESFPYDVCARIYYIALLIKNSRFDEAREILDNTVITKKTSNRNVIELIKIKLNLLCCERKYEECLKLFMENDLLLKKNLDTYYSLLVFLKTRLGLEVDVNNNEYHKSYTIEQLISYSEERALEHIKKHVDNFDKKNVTCFNSDFPVSELYYKLREILPIDDYKCLRTGMFSNLYFIKVPGCGRSFSMNIDYVKVVCIQDTNDIITMYPYDNKNNLPFIDLDLGLDYEREEPKKQNVKRLSQIEKFNQRYGK